LKVVCAWCKSTLEYSKVDDSITSHGICLACALNMLTEAGIDTNTFFMDCLRKKQPMKIIKPDECKETQEICEGGN
jgi:hypothetical protein